MSAWKKIGCAVDFSEPSRHALVTAAELARREDAGLVLLHAFEVPMVTGEMMVTPIDVGGTAAKEAARNMEAWVAEATALARRAVATRLVPGLPGDEVPRLAAAEGCDLLVVGTHGRTGVRHLVLGSVAEKIVRGATCDVLVARPRVPRP